MQAKEDYVLKLLEETGLITRSQIEAAKPNGLTANSNCTRAKKDRGFITSGLTQLGEELAPGQ